MKLSGMREPSSMDVFRPRAGDRRTTADVRLPQSQVRVVPLFLNESEPSRGQIDQPLPGMVITVGLEPIAVKQQWRETSKEMASILGALPADFPTHHQNLPSPNKTLQFYLPNGVLDDFTDHHHMPRLKRPKESAVFLCPTFVRLAELLLPTLEATHAFSPMFMENFVKLFCAHVVSLLETAGTSALIHRGGLSPWQRRRAIEVLDGPSGTKATMAALAGECGLSASHFARSFKLTFGMPVHRWVIAKQIERAKHLLLHSNEALSAIALATGFSNQAAFNRTFAKATGLSPGRWRRYFKV